MSSLNTIGKGMHDHLIARRNRIQITSNQTGFGSIGMRVLQEHMQFPATPEF
jgi:hypothetical protein